LIESLYAGVAAFTARRFCLNKENLMTNKPTAGGLALRKRADRMVASKPSTTDVDLGEMDVKRFFHELQVYQAELETQNEQLHQIIEEKSEQEERLRNIIKMTPAGYFRLDRDERFVDVNDAWLQMHGYGSPDEVIGKHFSIVQVDSESDSALKHLAELHRGLPIPLGEFSARRKDGSVGQHIFSAHPVLQAGRIIGFEWFIIDISERVKAEKAMRESEEKYRNLFNNAEVGIYRSRLDGSEILDANQKYLDIVGKSREETLGKPSAVDWVDQKEREEMVRTLIADGTVSGFEFKKLNRKDGSVRNCITSVALNREQRILEGSILDITERKRAEEEKAKLEGQLLMSQKMEAVGQLAGGVAHDFNNMLGVIIGYAELALMKVGPSEPIHANLCEIRSAAERSADLTRQLLAFARKQTIAPKVINLNETVSGMLKMLQRLIGENVNLTLQTASDLWAVKVDPSQIDQMLANLCVNARDAITNVGIITIETENSIIDFNYCAAHPYVEPGEYVRLAVSDNGIGMDKETLAHIFEPFFTTKGVGEGTGLGLATVYGIVKQNNGFINVYSEPGHGTTFTIYLPRHVGESGKALKEGETEPFPRGNETILLVEDEPAILKMATMILNMQGYTVLAANSPSEASLLACDHTAEIHLLMTDVVMPGMNGRDLALNLQTMYPQMKCLFMSGYTANVIAHLGVLDEGVHFIQKPFSLPDLMVKVREVLDGK